MKVMNFDKNNNQYKVITYYENGVKKIMVLSQREVRMAEMRAEQWHDKLQKVL